METFQTPELKNRSPDERTADQAALRALAQAAINVELFTIPLYMVSLYPIPDSTNPDQKSGVMEVCDFVGQARPSRNSSKRRSRKTTGSGRR